MEKFFKLKENNTNVQTEVIAGITTFITMAYIIFVNPQILGDIKGVTADMQTSIVIATCLSAAIGTLIMALYAKIPFAQAPGMGLNAFFAYTVASIYGYGGALAAVFISGLVFILVTVFGLREAIVKALPVNIKYAISAGIGLFIALIGLKNGGIIVANDATLISLRSFADPSSLETKAAILTLIGIIVIGILMRFRVKGAILIGILFSTIVAFPMGLTRWPEFTGFNISLAPTFLKMDFGALFNGDGNMFSIIFSAITIIIAFTMVDMFDTIGTLIGTGEKAGMVNEKGEIPRMKKALMADAVATSVGACLGTSTVTTYVESGAGIAEGGRTGLTSLVTGILFIFAVIIAPWVGIVPGSATAPALVIVGVLMMSAIKKISFDEITEAIPAFLTVVMMPFTYSIATGIAAGIISFSILKLCSGKGKEVHPVMYVLALLFILRYVIMPT